MGKPARFQLKVRHYEVDQYGHVNHAQYVHYLEVARIEALDALGLSARGDAQAGLSDPRRRPDGEVSGAGAIGETLEIVTYVREIRGARSI